MLNILPDPIASRLKESQQTIADDFSEATVLFADIVGFTDLSSKVLPDKFVSLVNEYFSAYDDLIDKHGLEKIKTIGDPFIVAAGILTGHKEHAKGATLPAAAALDLQAAMEQLDNRVAAVNIRI